jgi:predicted  nucleic acid-binding Zn-ribbon protein
MDVSRILLDLQARDLGLVRAHKRLDEMPEKRAILAARHKIAEIETLLERTERVERVLDAAVRKHEDESARIGEKIDHEQAKLLSGEVTHPKELQNISRELASLAKQREALDSDILAHMEKRETAQQQSDKVQGAIKNGRAKEAEMVADFQHKGSDLLGEIEGLKKERDALAAKLPADVRATYTKLLETKHGVAVGLLEGKSCSACRIELPGERLEALRRGPEISECPSCHRLLIVPRDKS